MIICPKCGKACNDGDFACANCGAHLNEAAPVEKTFGQKVAEACASPLFLTGCILATVAAIPLGGKFDVLMILTAVFLWLTYGNARKGDNLSTFLRCNSGVLYAKYIICWVVLGALIVGVILTVALSGVAGETMSSYHIEISDEIIDILNKIDLDDYLSAENRMELAEVGIDISRLGLGELLEQIASGNAYGLDSSVFFQTFFATLMVIGIVGCVIGAAIVIVVNLVFVRPLHKFAKSLYLSAQSGEAALVNAKKASTLMMVLGVLAAVGAGFFLGNAVTFLTSGCGAAAYIVMSVWTKNNFVA